MKKITFVSSYDGNWHGIYINGKLAYQARSLGPELVLRLLNIEYESKHTKEGWEDSHFPPNLEDLEIDR